MAVRPHIDSTSDQLLKIYLLPRKKDNIVHTMKQNHTKHIYFSFFNPLKMTGELEIEVEDEFMGANSVGANSPWGETGIICTDTCSKNWVMRALLPNTIPYKLYCEQIPNYGDRVN